jgi:hypothetical protein
MEYTRPRDSPHLPLFPTNYSKVLACKCLIPGAPGRIRTADHLVRSQVLYPAELRARAGSVAASREFANCGSWASGRWPPVRGTQPANAGPKAGAGRAPVLEIGSFTPAVGISGNLAGTIASKFHLNIIHLPAGLGTLAARGPWP